jgi:hypothetical protein
MRTVKNAREDIPMDSVSGRMSPSGWASFAGAILLLGASMQTACIQKVEKKEATADVNSSTYNPPVGVVDDNAGFYVRAVAVPEYTSYTHLGATSDYTYSGSFSYNTKCKVDVTSTDVTTKDILCYVEAEELDLYFHGMTLQFNVPSTSCDYFRFMPPYYFKYPAGTGPGATRYYTDALGATVDEINAPGGVPTCLYDYSKSAVPGPNCCFGKYSASVGTWDATAGAPTYTNSIVDWGGKAANCLSCPAMDTQVKDAGGFPIADLYFVKGTGLNSTYEIKSPLSKGLGSNVHIANYFISSTDYHTGNAEFPAAVRNASNAIVPANPIPGGFVHTNYGGSTEPFYSFTCFNRNREAKARIRLMIRSWDFEGMTNVAGGYVPTPGTEPSYGGAYHDYEIWEDFKGAAATYMQGYPGGSE